MSHACQCSILPNYLVREYIKDLQQAESQGIPVANITAGPYAHAHHFPAHGALISRLQQHLAFQAAVNTKLAQGAQHVLQAAAAGFAAGGAPFHPPGTHTIPADPDQQVYNMQNKVDGRYAEDESGNGDLRLPGHAVNANFDKDTQAVYDNSATVYKFYAAIFQRDSLDNRHMKLKSSVHFGEAYANAFWTDEDSQMVYGDGSPDILTNITTSLDVAGHEMTHGFINKAAGLNYNKESGALNESIADIFGLMTKQWHLKQSFSQADWLVGPGTVPYGDGLRSFKDAPANKYDLQPKNVTKMNEMLKNPRLREYIDEDNGGVHIWSGIPNHAFYTFVQSFGPDAKSYEIPGHIWYETVVSKEVDPNSTFKEFANLTVDIAQKNHGADVAKKLKDAWVKVEVLH